MYPFFHNNDELFDRFDHETLIVEKFTRDELIDHEAMNKSGVAIITYINGSCNVVSTGEQTFNKSFKLYPIYNDVDGYQVFSVTLIPVVEGQEYVRGEFEKAVLPIKLYLTHEFLDDWNKYKQVLGRGLYTITYTDDSVYVGHTKDDDNFYDELKWHMKNAAQHIKKVNLINVPSDCDLKELEARFIEFYNIEIN